MLPSQLLLNQKTTFKVVTFYSMPSAVLFVFRKRLSFVFITFLILTLLVI